MADLIQHITSTALANGFNQTDSGYVAQINNIPNAQMPFLFILQRTPDSTLKVEDVLKNSACEYTNLTLLAWDLYPSTEQVVKKLSAKWTELTKLLILTLQKAFGVDFHDMPDIPNIIRYKLIGNEMPLKRATSNHNGEYVEVQIDIQVKIFLGTI